MMRWCLALTLCCGCDLLWQLQHVDRVDGGTHDGVTGDGTTDAPTPCSVRNISPGDFDGDGKANDVDECPMSVTPSGDMDADGIGDDCDPHPNIGGDCLRVFTDFATPDPKCWQTIGWTFGCSTGDISGWCSPPSSNRTPLRYEPSVAIVFTRMTGEIISTTGPVPSVVMLNNYLLGANLTGDACGVASQSSNFAAVTGMWSNDVLSSGATTPMSPATAIQRAPILAFRDAQRCRAEATVTTTVAGAQLTPNPDVSGAFAVHTVNTRFRIYSLAGYSFGAACN